MTPEAIERMEAMLAEFYGRSSTEQYDRTLSLVSEEMACQTDPKQSLSSSAPSQSA